MQEKLQQYLNTLETMRNNANEGDKEALNYCIARLQAEHYRASLEMFSS